MTKRKRLGQHYLFEEGLISEVVATAGIRRWEKVLEIGTGRGELTQRLCRESDAVEAYEIDAENYAFTKERLRGAGGLKIHLGDAFDADPAFDVLVSSLPYSRSSDFVEWLSARAYDRAVVILQEDFVSKLLAKPGTKSYRGVSVISQLSSSVEVVRKVGRSSFRPQPKVGSVVVRIRPRRSLSREVTTLIKRLFTIKRRRLGTVLKELKVAQDDLSGERLGEKVYAMAPEAIFEMVERILNRGAESVTA